MPRASRKLARTISLIFGRIGNFVLTSVLTYVFIRENIFNSVKETLHLTFPNLVLTLKTNSGYGR